MGSVRCTNIGILEDNVIEGSHVFEVALSSNDPVVFGVSSAPVTILDNDGWCMLFVLQPTPFHCDPCL